MTGHIRAAAPPLATALSDSRLDRLFASFDSQAVTTVTLQSPCTVSSRRERSHSIAAHGVHALPLSNQTQNPRPTHTKSTTSGSPEFCASGIPRTQTLRKGFAHSDPRQRHGLKTRPRTQHMSCLPPGTELRSMSSLVSGGRRGFYMPALPHNLFKDGGMQTCARAPATLGKSGGRPASSFLSPEESAWEADTW